MTDDPRQLPTVAPVVLASLRGSFEDQLKQVGTKPACSATQSAVQRQRRTIQLALAVSVMSLTVGAGIACWSNELNAANSQRLAQVDASKREAVRKRLNETETRRSAESNRNAIVDASDPSGTTVDLIQQAKASALKKQYAHSVRLYREAFAKDSGLVNPRETAYRYAAACAAALAANGEGSDPPPSGERPELRRQARDWLAAELIAWTNVLEKSPPMSREEIHAKMAHWLSDRNLASIREPELLKKLHPNELFALERFWRDVRALRDRAAPPEVLPAPRANP